MLTRLVYTHTGHAMPDTTAVPFPLDGWMTLTEAAAAIGVGEQTVRRYLDSQRLPASRRFSRLLIPREAVERLIASKAEYLVPSRAVEVL